MMRYEVLFVVRDEYYYVVFDVSKSVDVDDIFEYLKQYQKYNYICDSQSLAEALDEYCRSHTTEYSSQSWFFKDFSGIMVFE